MEVAEIDARVEYVDRFDEMWGTRWRPAMWAGVVDRLHGHISRDDLRELAERATGPGRTAWDRLVSMAGAEPAEFSPGDGPHDECGNPLPTGTTRTIDTSSILAREYVPLLCGRVPDASGKIRCPFHKGGEERNPSFAVKGPHWRCFSCATGGTVIDFAATLWGLGTRGADFLEVKRRLSELGIGV